MLETQGLLKGGKSIWASVIHRQPHAECLHLEFCLVCAIGIRKRLIGITQVFYSLRSRFIPSRTGKQATAHPAFLEKLSNGRRVVAVQPLAVNQLQLINAPPQLARMHAC